MSQSRLTFRMMKTRRTTHRLPLISVPVNPVEVAHETVASAMVALTGPAGIVHQAQQHHFIILASDEERRSARRSGVNSRPTSVLSRLRSLRSHTSRRSLSRLLLLQKHNLVSVELFKHFLTMSR
jgi:hypothetical protein